MDKPMQGVRAQICGVVHEITVPERGPTVLTVRVSHGKDKQTGNWKPSSWYRVKAFGDKAAMLKDVTTDALVTVGVYGATDEWTAKDGTKKSDKAWYLLGIEVHEHGRMPASAPSLRDTVAIAAGSDEVPF